MDSREAILSRIRAANVPFQEYQRSRTSAQVPSVERFCELVADYRANVIRVSQSEVSRHLARLVGDEKCLVPPNLGIELRDSRTDDRLSTREIDQFDVSVTLCAVGIEETGTIVLDGGPGQGRRAISLIPDHHICLIFEEQIVSSLEDALERLNPRQPLTFISGPSATSDIELVRVEGVHGPRRLDVMVINKR